MRVVKPSTSRRCWRRRLYTRWLCEATAAARRRPGVSDGTGLVGSPMRLRQSLARELTQAAAARAAGMSCTSCGARRTASAAR